VQIQNKTVFETLLDIGLATKVCFGVEINNDDLMRSPIDLELSDATPFTAAVRALKARPGSSVAAGGLLSVQPKARSPASWLEFRIHRFTVGARVNVPAASNVLFMSMRQQIKPGEGYAGHYGVVDDTDLVGPFDEKGKTVRELLNLIVTSSKGALWVTTGPCVRKGSPPDLFWTILEYSDPSLKSREVIQMLEQRITAGLAR
jgi:hypothetical protein